MVFVKLVEGHEPLLVAIEMIVSLEGDSGGSTTLVGLVNGTSKRVKLPVDEVMRRIREAADDWVDHTPAKKARIAR